MESNFSVGSIEDTIQRTRQIMQESKAITIKNLQRKNMLEERFMFDDLKPEKDSSSINNSEIVRRISEIEIRNQQETPMRTLEDAQKIEELQNEIKELTLKVKNQAMRIQYLETNLSDVNIEKMHLLSELKTLKREHEIEISRISQKYEDSELERRSKRLKEADEFSQIEERIKVLEEKYKQQVLANHELIEDIKKLQNSEGMSNTNSRISELEDLLIESMRKYKILKDRLDKTENLLALDHSHLSPKPSVSKKCKGTSPKTSTCRPKKKHLNKNKSASIKSPIARLS
ncbi:hypothetical protein SteCoe_33734 [Stentor coeruleus]|uniref:Uncharacterized protein n=1 Tax=Stentor coeruleus TaxID=5963 RepID=A0A1R2AW56_9CILI|nr:hypothetical protein SteCoe_33734 [Stentor coeruleus]